MAVVLGVLGSTNPVEAQAVQLAERSKISVVGRGQVPATPNLADVSVGVSTQAQTAKGALAKNSETMTSLHNSLKEKGVEAKDIETTQFYVYPVYSQPSPRQPPGEEFTPRVVGYRVVNMVKVTVRQIDKLGDLLDLVVKSGANEVHGINLRVDNDNELLDRARKLAMADAKRKAELLAKEADVTLGMPWQIIENGTEAPQYWSVPAPTQMSGVSPAPRAPIATGEREVSVTIQISYEIVPSKPR